MAYTVYILQCKNGSLYIGITTDLQRRFREHQDKKGGAYTRSHPVVKIVHTERRPNRSAASRRETELKTWSRTKKLALIRRGTRG